MSTFINSLERTEDGAHGSIHGRLLAWIVAFRNPIDCPIRNAFLSLLLSIPLAAAETSSAPTAPAIRWEKEISAIEAKYSSHQPPIQGIVFTGGSSIRLWRNLRDDFAEFTVLNHGFGGSQLADAVHFAPRLIWPYQPRAVVVYAGDNDLAAGKSPETIANDSWELSAAIWRKLPRANILFIAIKPSPSRWKFADAARRANALIKSFTETDPRLGFADVFTPMLGADGSPRPELFVADRLHLNPAGYRLWSEIVRPELYRLTAAKR